MLVHVEFEEMPDAEAFGAGCYIVCQARSPYKALRRDPSEVGVFTDVGTSGVGAPRAGGTCALLHNGFIFNPALGGNPPPRRNKQYAFEVDPQPRDTILELLFTVQCPVIRDWTFALRVDQGAPLTHTISFGKNPADLDAPTTTRPNAFYATLTLTGLVVTPPPWAPTGPLASPG
jgi:hypothetical protein